MREIFKIRTNHFSFSVFLTFPKPFVALMVEHQVYGNSGITSHTEGSRIQNKQSN